MRRITLCALALSAALAGCAGGEVYYGGGGTLTATTVAPDLLYVSPGVQVVADYDDPVFYADSYYWRFDSGRWYRSNWYTGGWVYATPPSAVLRIDRPYAYRHYRPAGYVARRPYVRDHRESRPVYRESRPIYRESRPDHGRRDGGVTIREARPRGAPAPTVYRPTPTPRTTRPSPEARPAPAEREREHRPRRVVRDHR